MIRESVIENTIISFLQDQGYELFDANDDWFSSRRLDEFINKELFLSCLDKINKYNEEDATAASLDDAYIPLGANSENSQYRYDIPTLFNSKTSVSYGI